MLRRLEGIWIGVIALVWFGILTPWGRFADPDAFYHAHVAELILKNGPLHSFPWLDLTTFGQHFVDAHFLFHVMLIPGVAIAQHIVAGPFTAFWGAQVTGAILATGTILLLWAALRQVDAKRAWMWTALALFIPGFSTRLLLGKASPIAVGLFVALIGLVIGERSGRTLLRWLLIAAVGFFFTLSHGGWIILILTMGVLIAGEILFERFGRSTSWASAIRTASWDSLLAVLVGIGAGILLHPNRNELLQFLWVQVIKAGSGNNASVVQGGEWTPALPSFVVYHLAALVIPALIGLWGLVLTWTGGSRPDESRMKQLIILSLPLALTLALTLNSRRFVEYLAPAMVLWTAALWTLVDEKRVIASVHRLVPKLIAVGFVAIAIHQAADTWSELRRPAGRTFDAWRPALAAISERANPGDRVFADWDEFPTLFAADDRLTYVGGLDPVFLDDADPHLSAAVEALLRGRATSTAWSVIGGQTASRFVFLTPKRHPALYEALKSDPRFHELMRDDEAAAYEIK